MEIWLQRHKYHQMGTIASSINSERSETTGLSLPAKPQSNPNLFAPSNKASVTSRAGADYKFLPLFG